MTLEQNVDEGLARAIKRLASPVTYRSPQPPKKMHFIVFSSMATTLSDLIASETWLVCFVGFIGRTIRSGLLTLQFNQYIWFSIKTKRDKPLSAFDECVESIALGF